GQCELINGVPYELNETYNVWSMQLENSYFLGCFYDKKTRDLAGGFLTDSSMTVELCLQYCNEKGYMYAGLQYWKECYCGNTFGRYGASPQSECKFKCSGNNAQTCGGLSINSVHMNISHF
ncbi:unnamed protein product, partial [Owenia fusiformis]